MRSARSTVTQSAYFAAFIVAVIFLQSCSNYPVVGDGAPQVNKQDLMRVPDAVPKAELVTKAGNKDPYSVFGVSYRLLPKSEGYRASGTASWYGTKFHGRNTSNGDVYDMNAMTAAHKTLPIPCYVRVTNKRNNRSVVVRVNDRGPFHGDRLIDMSYAAAVKLGFADQGTAPVDVEVITASAPRKIINVQQSSPSKPNAAVVQVQPRRSATLPIPVKVPAAAVSPTVTAVPQANSQWFLQAGAFYDEQSAQHLRKRLQYITALPVVVLQEATSEETVYKVRIGPNKDQKILQKLQNEIRAVNMGSPYLVSQSH